MIATAIFVTIIINIVITDNEKWNNKLTLIRARNWIHCTRHWKRKSKNVQIIRINSIISVITRKTFLASEKLQSVELFFSLPFVEDRVFLNSFKYHNWSHSITPINWYDDRGKKPQPDVVVLITVFGEALVRKARNNHHQNVPGGRQQYD